MVGLKWVDGRAKVEDPNELVVISFKIQRSAKEKLLKHAKDLGIPYSEILRVLVNDYLEHAYIKFPENDFSENS